jgi:hypothetical protein
LEGVSGAKPAGAGGKNKPVNNPLFSQTSTIKKFGFGRVKGELTNGFALYACNSPPGLLILLAMFWEKSWFTHSSTTNRTCFSCPSGCERAQMF